MKKWKYQIDLSGFFNDEDMTIYDKAKFTALRIKLALRDLVDHESSNYDSYIGSVYSDFYTLGQEEDDEELIDDSQALYNSFLQDLYNWGDHNKTAWIKT